MLSIYMYLNFHKRIGILAPIEFLNLNNEILAHKDYLNLLGLQLPKVIM